MRYITNLIFKALFFSYESNTCEVDIAIAKNTKNLKAKTKL